MNEPIKSGDLAEVVGGLGRAKSPNLGLQVRVGQARGEHSVHGRIFRCHSENVCQLSDSGGYIKPGWADFPVSWLKKIEPDENVTTKGVENATTI